MTCASPSDAMDALDRALIEATEAGLPLTQRPYETIAARIGSTEQEVMVRLQRMLADGRLRRIAAVPNHYAIGYRANGMTVWDVSDERVDELGASVGALDFVSHCYRRPRHLPRWPYNLFAMVHGRSRDETNAQVLIIADLLGAHCRTHEVLYSTRLLKKTGLRLKRPDKESMPC